MWWNFVIIPVALPVATLAVAWPFVRTRSLRARQLAFAASIAAEGIWWCYQVLVLSGWRVGWDLAMLVAVTAGLSTLVYFEHGWWHEIRVAIRARYKERGDRPVSHAERVRTAVTLSVTGGTVILLFGLMWFAWAHGY